MKENERLAGEERNEPPAHDGGWPVSDARVLATASGAAFAGLGRITQMVSQDGTSTYGYDSKSQLTSATHSYQSNETYTFDNNGNRTMSGYQTGTDNRLTNDGTYGYQYDAEGNRTRRTKTATGEVTEYEWDYRNRLVKVTEKWMVRGQVHLPRWMSEYAQSR